MKGDKYKLSSQVDEKLKNLVVDYANKEYYGNESLAIRKIVEKFFENKKHEEV